MFYVYDDKVDGMYFKLQELMVIKKLHIGCGMNAPVDFENFDASPTLRFERFPILGALYTKNEKRFPKNVNYGNIVNGINVKNESFDACYCSHVLEHLSKEEFFVAINNIYKYLKKGGVFRLVMPDLHQYAKNYIENYDRGDPNSSIVFIAQTLLGVEELRRRSLLSIIKNGLANSRHMWLWDDITTIAALKKVGYTNIVKRGLYESDTNYFTSIEVEDSFNSAFCIECIK